MKSKIEKEKLKVEFLLKMKTKREYYKRNVITHGDSTKHYPSGTSILMDMMITSIQRTCRLYHLKKLQKK